jgi:hypothetical protein
MAQLVYNPTTGRLCVDAQQRLLACCPPPTTTPCQVEIQVTHQPCFRVCFDVVFLTPHNPAQCTYLWNFGDGTTSNLKNPCKTFANGAQRQITLTVTCGNDQCTRQTLVTPTSLNCQVVTCPACITSTAPRSMFLELQGAVPSAPDPIPPPINPCVPCSLCNQLNRVYEVVGPLFGGGGGPNECVWGVNTAIPFCTLDEFRLPEWYSLVLVQLSILYNAAQNRTQFDVLLLGAQDFSVNPPQRTILWSYKLNVPGPQLDCFTFDNLEIPFFQEDPWCKGCEPANTRVLLTSGGPL